MIGESPAQRPVTRKMFPFDDVIMESIDGTHLFGCYAIDSKMTSRYQVETIPHHMPFVIEIHW